MRRHQRKSRERLQLPNILKKLGLTGHASAKDAISKAFIRELMGMRDIEVQGAVFYLITEPQHSARVRPKLTFQDYRKFVLDYLGRCVMEDPQSEWADSRWEACYDLGKWFSVLWSDQSVDRSALDDFKSVIQKLYLAGDLKTRQAIINGTLEHLFEEPSVRDFFAGWRVTPELQKAFDEAAKWSKKRGQRAVGGWPSIRAKALSRDT